MRSKAYAALVLTGALTLSPLFASAQVTPPPGGGQRQRLELERQVRLGFQRSIQNQLQLDQGQVQALQGITQSFEEERSDLSLAQASLRHRLRDPALRDLAEDDARAFLQEMVALQERELDLYKREQAELLNSLTPVQLVRFYRLRDDMGQRVQRLRQGRGQGGGRGGIGGLPTPAANRGSGGRFFR